MVDQRQQGQAISEFLVAMIWLVPVVLAFVAVAHMLNVQSTAHEAARYVAWERLAYSGDAYNQRLGDNVNGFGAEVTQRFFVDGQSGFGSAAVATTDPAWQDWQSKQSIVDTTKGVNIDSAASNRDVYLNQQGLSGLLKYRSGKSSWIDGRGGIELDTSTTAELNVPIRVEGNSVFRMEGHSKFDTNDISDPKVSSSYALIADSWTATTEQGFSDMVAGVVPDGLTDARLWLQNNGGARRFRSFFAEVDQKLFSDPDSPANSLSTISPQQSTALPAVMLEDYVEP